jgi:hypothetical protein
VPDDFVLPTELPPVDPGPLLDTAARIRSTLSTTDPASQYFGRPDAAKAAETNVAAMLLRAGVAERPAETAEQIAAQQHAASVRFGTMPAGLVSTIDERVAAVEQRGNVESQAKALRDQLGAATYDALVTEARHARAELGGAAADLIALRLLSAQGRYTRQTGRKP